MKPAWIKRGKHWRQCQIIEQTGGYVRWVSLAGTEYVTRDVVRFTEPSAKDRPTTKRQQLVIDALSKKPMTSVELIKKTSTNQYSIRALMERGLIRINDGWYETK